MPPHVPPFEFRSDSDPPQRARNPVSMISFEFEGTFGIEKHVVPTVSSTFDRGVEEKSDGGGVQSRASFVTASRRVHLTKTCPGGACKSTDKFNSASQRDLPCMSSTANILAAIKDSYTLSLKIERKRESRVHRAIPMQK